MGNSWISVRDHLPALVEHVAESSLAAYLDARVLGRCSYSTRVLVYVPSRKRLTIAILEESGEWREDLERKSQLENIDVSHWQPLPTAPFEEMPAPPTVVY